MTIEKGCLTNSGGVICTGGRFLLFLRYEYSKKENVLGEARQE